MNINDRITIGTVPFGAQREDINIDVKLYEKTKEHCKPVTILSISGSIHNVCWGQIEDTIDLHFRKYVSDLKLWDKLYAIWKRWHLNDLRAGTPAQEEAIRKQFPYGYPGYNEACEYLKTIDLYVDPHSNYRYGSAWLTEEVPEEIITELLSICAGFKKGKTNDNTNTK